MHWIFNSLRSLKTSDSYRWPEGMEGQMERVRALYYPYSQCLNKDALKRGSSGVASLLLAFCEVRRSRVAIQHQDLAGSINSLS